MLKRLVLVLGLGAFVLTSAPVFAQGNSPEATKCRSSKMKCGCKKVCARFKAISGLEKNGDTAKFAAANSKLESQYSVCMSKANGKGGCPSGASDSTLEAKVDSFVSSYSTEIGSPSGAFLR